MKIGAHVSAAGSIDKAIDRAVEIGAECVQVFASPPQGWGFKPIDEKAAADFKIKSMEYGVGPNVFHGVYLMNFGAEESANLGRSKGSLVSYMNAAHDLGVLGVIFHLGSHKGRGFDAVFDQVVGALRDVLAKSPEDALLILENSAGMGNHIGCKFSELGVVLKELNDPRVKICLDTQHSYASGFDITTPEGVSSAMEAFDRDIGLEHLAAVHCNDSKRGLGSAVDRHENIGEGFMGLGAFEAIMAHPAFRDVPFYLEVPGYEGKGPDQRNVDAVKAIRERVLTG